METERTRRRIREVEQQTEGLTHGEGSDPVKRLVEDTCGAICGVELPPPGGAGMGQVLPVPVWPIPEETKNALLTRALELGFSIRGFESLWDYYLETEIGHRAMSESTASPEARRKWYREWDACEARRKEKEKAAQEYFEAEAYKIREALGFSPELD